MAIKEVTSPERAEVQLQWIAVLERDLLWDGVFFFGVRSTGIYCRPSCPSRRPRRNQVRFFSVTNAAEDAGFRACLRCKPNDVAPPGPVRLVHLVCTLLEQNVEGTHTLTAICQHIGVGPRTVPVFVLVFSFLVNRHLEVFSRAVVIGILCTVAGTVFLAL